MPRTGWRQRTSASTPDDARAVRRDLRLVVQLELVVGDRVAQLLLDKLLHLHRLVDAALEEAVAVAPVVLGLVERAVGELDQARDVLARHRRERDADGAADVHLGAADADGLAQGLADAPGQRAGLKRRLRLHLDDRELVAAEPRHDVRPAHGVGDAARHLADHLVARPVAERVVHVLELVEVHQHQREAGAVALAARDLFLDAGVEAHLVEQARQVVVAGHPARAVLLLREVGGERAKASEQEKERADHGQQRHHRHDHELRQQRAAGPRGLPDQRPDHGTIRRVDRQAVVMVAVDAAAEADRSQPVAQADLAQREAGEGAQRDHDVPALLRAVLRIEGHGDGHSEPVPVMHERRPAELALVARRDELRGVASGFRPPRAVGVAQEMRDQRRQRRVARSPGRRAELAAGHHGAPRVDGVDGVEAEIAPGLPEPVRQAAGVGGGRLGAVAGGAAGHHGGQFELGARQLVGDSHLQALALVADRAAVGLVHQQHQRHRGHACDDRDHDGHDDEDPADEGRRIGLEGHATTPDAIQCRGHATTAGLMPGFRVVVSSRSRPRPSCGRFRRLRPIRRPAAARRRPRRDRPPRAHGARPGTA